MERQANTTIKRIDIMTFNIKNADKNKDKL